MTSFSVKAQSVTTNFMHNYSIFHPLPHVHFQDYNMQKKVCFPHTDTYDDLSRGLWTLHKWLDLYEARKDRCIIDLQRRLIFWGDGSMIFKVLSAKHHLFKISFWCGQVGDCVFLSTYVLSCPQTSPRKSWVVNWTDWQITTSNQCRVLLLGGAAESMPGGNIDWHIH